MKSDRYRNKKYFFCGIAGSGMSALAQVLAHKECRVMGSDRSFDQNKNLETMRCLNAQGIEIFPQNGRGIFSGIDIFIVSTAVERGVPDVREAIKHGIKIQKRSELLAELFHRGRGIAVGGTSGKTTVTGMIGYILTVNGVNPTVINGGVMINVREDQPGGLGNVRLGRDDIMVMEADESDGTIDLYFPSIAVVTNITLDHKPLEELRRLFGDFIKRAGEGAVINLDCPETIKFRRIRKKVMTFGIDNPDARVRATDLKTFPGGTQFKVAGIGVFLPLPGRHNVSNALAAMAAAKLMGIGLDRSAEALRGFHGIRRRLEVLGKASGVTVIDDFAHNPDKITASLNALKENEGRLLVVFQPHGFGPTRFLREKLVESFIKALREDDLLLMPEIFYGGGTVEKDISSADLVNNIKAGGKNARFFSARSKIGDYLLKNAKEGDRVVVMGARDDTLTVLARDLLNKIVKKERAQ